MIVKEFGPIFFYLLIMILLGSLIYTIDYMCNLSHWYASLYQWWWHQYRLVSFHMFAHGMLEKLVAHTQKNKISFLLLGMSLNANLGLFIYYLERKILSIYANECFIYKIICSIRWSNQQWNTQTTLSLALQNNNDNQRLIIWIISDSNFG